MGNWKAVLKKPYKGKNVKIAKKLFAKAMKRKDYYFSAKIGFLLGVIKGGTKGILKTLQRANMIYKRKGAR